MAPSQPGERFEDSYPDLSDDEDVAQQAPELANRRNVAQIGGNQSDITSEATMAGASNRTAGGEARIVAPNVSKLSPHSAVEVRLQSTTECVAVLCSVDVLKMRSGFFHDVLCEQESATQLTGQGGVNETLPELNPNVLWRQPIVVPEISPFEAAAFLESLHEGRALFSGNWSLCWARLR